MSRDPVVTWAEHHRAPIRSTDPDAPAGDLRPLGRAAAGARIVGLGEAAHNLAEITTLKHRAVRHLVEHRGFRSIAWEEDWSLGTQIDDYLAGHRDDLEALVGQMSRTAWRTREVADVLAWLRRYNDSHHDDVRFFGVEYFATRPFAYDRIEAWVARHRPDRYGAVREHLTAIRPTTDDMGAYLDWFRHEVDDKAAFVRHTEALHDLVAGITDPPDPSGHAEVLHAARQVRSFYTAFILTDNAAFRDARAAENLRWWEQRTDHPVIYWAASAHTADVPELTAVVPPMPDTTFASAGSFLRDWYGDRYVSVGFTFDHGTVAGPDGPLAVPPPARDWFEHPLGRVAGDQFLLDLRRAHRAPPAVRDWLTAPMRTRGQPGVDHGSTLSGGTAGEWFDLVVHRRAVTPAAPLT